MLFKIVSDQNLRCSLPWPYINSHFKNRKWVNGNRRIAYLKSSCDADHFEHKHEKVKPMELKELFIVRPLSKIDVGFFSLFLILDFGANQNKILGKIGWCRGQNMLPLYQYQYQTHLVFSRAGSAPDRAPWQVKFLAPLSATKNPPTFLIW